MDLSGDRFGGARNGQPPKRSFGDFAFLVEGASGRPADRDSEKIGTPIEKI